MIAPLDLEARAVVARIVDEAPALTDEKADRIAVLLDVAS